MVLTAHGERGRARNGENNDFDLSTCVNYCAVGIKVIYAKCVAGILIVSLSLSFESCSKRSTFHCSQYKDIHQGLSECYPFMNFSARISENLSTARFISLGGNSRLQYI